MYLAFSVLSRLGREGTNAREAALGASRGAAGCVEMISVIGCSLVSDYRPTVGKRAFSRPPGGERPSGPYTFSLESTAKVLKTINITSHCRGKSGNLTVKKCQLYNSSQFSYRATLLFSRFYVGFLFILLTLHSLYIYRQYSKCQQRINRYPRWRRRSLP